MNESVHPQGEPAAAPVGAPSTRVVIEERQAWSLNGWFGVLIALLCIGGVWWLVVHGHSYVAIVPGVVAVVILTSLVIVQPGQTRVVQFFGRYVGTVRRPGLSWVVPLADRRNVSVRVRNFETNHLKVNDADGNPVEIAAIVVWQVADTSRALYAVDDYLNFVPVQAESALRHVATTHPYDDASDERHLAARLDRRSSPPSWPPRSRSGSSWPGSRSSRCGSATSPTPPRSPRRCCAASRPTPWSPRGRGSSREPSAWSRWPWSG